MAGASSTSSPSTRPCRSLSCGRRQHDPQAGVPRALFPEPRYPFLPDAFRGIPARKCPGTFRDPCTHTETHPYQRILSGERIPDLPAPVFILNDFLRIPGVRKRPVLLPLSAYAAPHRQRSGYRREHLFANVLPVSVLESQRLTPPQCSSPEEDPLRPSTYSSVLNIPFCFLSTQGRERSPGVSCHAALVPNPFLRKRFDACALPYPAYDAPSGIPAEMVPPKDS